MKYLLFISVFLVVSWFPSFNIALAENKEKVIVISEIVGDEIDAEERERFGLWPEIKGFKSTIFLQLSDGNYVAEVIYEENGKEKKARTPQSEMAMKSLKSYIEKVSKGEIQPAPLVDEGKYAGYTKGELLSISGKIGASIDKNESNEYGIFMTIQNFERATFYCRKEGGYLIEIQTVTDTLISVVLDKGMVSILGDYIDGYEKVRTNRESFEKKWSIISYDEQGIPITENEMLRYHKKSSCCALGCALGGGAVGFAIGTFIALTQWSIHDDEKIVTSYMTGIFLGGGVGYFIGNKINNRIDKDGIVRKIKDLRTPK